MFSFFHFFFGRKIWRQTTWGGWVVRQIQAVSDHFKPFVDDVAGIVSDEDSVAKVMMYTLIRIVVIFIIVGLVFALGRVLQYIIGTEIVKEEEGVIVHEYATEEEAAKARAAEQRKTKRDKKQKNQ